jgi:putative tryptophan/tyrosine transport system substrate-binding protein
MHFDRLNRREAITLLGGASIAWPITARAQQASMPVVGFLNAQTPHEFTHLVVAFHRGLNEGGFVEGQNVAIEYRWAEQHYDRLPGLAADLVRRQVSVIVGTGGAHVEAIAASRTIPIICSFGGDPVKAGFVESINRPGKNVTGVITLSTDLEAKKLELLRELLPRPALIAVLLDSKFSDAEGQLKEIQSAAHALRQQIEVFIASSPGEIDAAFAALVQMRAAALTITGGPFFNNRLGQLAALAARHAIPTVFAEREYVSAGGLMSYGSNIPDVYRKIGEYTARVLKGEKPANLPILLPTKFNMAVNLKTAKLLGITIPTALLLLADEVIE